MTYPAEIMERMRFDFEIALSEELPAGVTQKQVDVARAFFGLPRGFPGANVVDMAAVRALRARA